MFERGVNVKIGEVESILDDTDGARIKVRLLPDDRGKSIDDIPYALPLMPKLFHVIPKVGELVLIFLGVSGEGLSTRHYVGPIISQPQHMDYDEPLSALSLYPGSHKEPEVAPSTNANSHGAFAKENDIAIYGRGKSDVIMTDDDIRIRCGSRVKDSSDCEKIIFNRLDPAFIQLKHTDIKQGEANDEFRSTATVVADKINLISHLSNEPFKTNDKDKLITEEEMLKIIAKAHELPYGDILVDFLKLFVKAFAEHVHPYPGLPPCQTDNYIKTVSYDMDKILSNNIKIN